MTSPTIVLAGNESQDWDFVLLAAKNAAGDCDVVVVRDGESVVDSFLHNQRRRSKGPFAHLVEPHKCDLLFLDLFLPKLDGFQVLRQLRWLRRDDLSTLPPIVMLSESGDSDLVAAAYRYGASGFLSTATSAAQLRDATEQTLRYWLDATLRPGPLRSQRSADPSLLSPELTTT